MAKFPDIATQKWLTAAELAAGKGTGWPVRFVELAAEAAAEKIPGAVTVTAPHIRNVMGGSRQASDDMRRLLIAVTPAAVERLRAEADQLEALVAEIKASLPAPARRAEYTKEQYEAETTESMAMLNEMAGIKPVEGDDK